MKRFIILMFSKLVYLLCFVSFIASAQPVDLEPVVEEPLQQEGFDWADLKKVWGDDIQFHGFVSQGLFHTTGNNVYGQSKNSVSAGLTEIGLNMSYQALNNLSFAAQGLYRRAGESTGDSGELTLDFAFVDITLLNFPEGRLGIRGGRIKNPWGFYNETRDVASTHPTILLPLVYFDRSRSLFLALDGGQVYADYYSSIGDFAFKLNYGWANPDEELLRAMTLNPLVPGQLKGNPSLVTQLSYDIMGGLYGFAIGYAHADLGYTPGNSFDLYTGFKSKFDSFMLSARYSGEKFSFVAEYNLQWNDFSGIPFVQPDDSSISEYWYVQAGYRILDNLQMTLRYDSAVQDIDDRSGGNFHQQSGGFYPANLRYAEDIVVGLRWDITPSWMVRIEYSRVHGAATVSLLDNPKFLDLATDWNIYGLQVAYRF